MTSLYTTSRIDRLRILWKTHNKDASQPSSSQSYNPPIQVTRPKPRLFALIIGINLYDNVRSLRGAVPDAISVKEYLETYLQVPGDHIRVLLNQSATRAAIISELVHLKDDPRITRGDPILIFYAGHGSEISMPEAWSSDSHSPDTKIQVIVPQDYCSKPEQKIEAIPDRTFAALLENVAKNKGDNITVIFDCCHSASGTRDDGPSLALTRTIELGSGISDGLDRDIWERGERGQHLAPRFLNSGLRSHVLIAACSSSESAHEENSRGNFTSALLKLLRTNGPDRLRYSDILSKMDPIPQQNPQCEGVNKERYLFNAEVSFPTVAVFPVHSNSEQGEMILDAGAANGITVNTEFAVYSDKDSVLNTQPLGKLVVHDVDAFSCTTMISPDTPSFVLNSTGVALQIGTGDRKDLRIYVPDGQAFVPFYDALVSLLQDSTSDFRNILLVDAPIEADFEVTKEGERYLFRIQDDRITRYGFHRLFHDISANTPELKLFLKSAAHYYWELNRTKNNPSVTQGVRVEIFKLEESQFDFDDFGHPEMLPSSTNLCRDGLFDFVVEEDVAYGIKLTNNTPYDLFPNLFYFDNSDLSIGAYYQSPSGSGPYAPDVPLKKNGGILTIGYGSGGVPPFSYFLREKQDLDVGFLKLFLSSQPLDLSSIPQDSPFGDTSRAITDPKKDGFDPWGTLLIPVVQRRYPDITSHSQDDILSLQDEVNALKRENKILHESSARGFQRCEALIEELEKKKRTIMQLSDALDVEREKVTQLTASLEAERKGKGGNNAIVVLPEHNVNSSFTNQAQKRNSKPRKPSLGERARRFLGFHA